ncbi:hypothetical protein OC844_000039, partial [Tilletia horrida]
MGPGQTRKRVKQPTAIDSSAGPSGKKSSNAQGPAGVSKRAGQSKSGTRGVGPSAKAQVKQEVKKEVKQEVKKESKVKHEGVPNGSDDSDSDTDGSMTDGSAEDIMIVSVVCYPMSAINSKSPKPTPFRRTIEITTKTSLSSFFDKIERRGSMELLGNIKDWTVALQTNSRSDHFAQPVVVDHEEEEASRTYSMWLDSVSNGKVGNILAYGVPKPHTFQADDNSQFGPIPHVDPAIASLAQQIRKANTCGDEHCPVKTIKTPWCWPITKTDTHVNLNDDNVLRWAVALAAKENGVSVNSPPNISPFNGEKKSAKKGGKAKKEKRKRDTAASEPSDHESDVEFLVKVSPANKKSKSSNRDNPIELLDSSQASEEGDGGQD